MYTALLKGSKVGSNATLGAAYSIARLRGGRKSIYNSLLSCGFVDKLVGVNSYGKLGLGARRMVASQWLLVHE